jgi:GT2 family glycosyltransferase
MDPTPISIVVPNFNGEGIVAASLNAVVRAGEVYPGKCEVILVDDASTDRSIEIVAAMMADIRIVRHKVNRGFSEAVHSGISAASHEAIVLLNSDVHPDGEFIAPLISALDDPSVFAASPLIADGTGNPMFVSWTRYRIVRGKLKAKPWSLDDAEERCAHGLSLKGLYASGGSMAFRKEKFHRLGGFLDIYKPFYSEDLDLGTRAWMQGWKTVFVPESRVLHMSTGTIKRFYSARRVRTTRIRNRLVFLSLYAAPGKLFLSYLPWNLLRGLTRLLRLDTTMVAALWQLAWIAPRVAAIRARLKAERSFKTIEEVLEEVNAD